jgi:multiple sugar transport system permease protein
MSTVQETLSTIEPRRRLEGQRRRDRTLGIVMLAPALTYITLLVAVPFALAVVLSVTNSSAGSLEFSFVGLQKPARS